MPDNYRDFETRKSVHINLTRGTHAEFRKILFDCSLSMQEVFEECAIRLIEKDEYFVSLTQELQNRKRMRISRKFTPTDAESIFQAIEDKTNDGTPEGA